MKPSDQPTAGDVEEGDALNPGPPVQVSRYTGATRLNHWINATCFVLLVLSGLSLFHPSLFFLSSLFGGGQWTRTIHPWIGVVLFLSFVGLFLRFWRANLPVGEDGTWIAHIVDVLRDHEEKLPELGKYNAGQKFVLWSMGVLIIMLFVTGIVMWDTYFYSFTTIEQKRIAVLIHAVAAVCAICVLIIHVYAGIWVKGSIGAMASGKVTGGWAWRHHRKWLRELVDKSAGRSASGPGAPAE